MKHLEDNIRTSFVHHKRIKPYMCTEATVVDVVELEESLSSIHVIDPD